MLTDRKVARLKEPGRYRDVAPGLYVVVGASGSKSWIYRYQRAGREHMLGLGSVDAFDVREARLRARAARQQLADGVDPIEAKRKAAAAAALEAARAMTFAAAAEAYVAQHEAKWTRVHHHQVLNSLKMYALPVIGDLRVDAIGVPEVLRVIEALWVSKTTTADRVRNRIELVLDWAKARGLRSGDNPAAWKVIGHILPAKADIAPVKHFAAMPYAELPAFMAELRAVPGIGLRALEFAILTAARSGEVLGARWDEIDLDGAMWVIPADRMKAGREHRVPLSAPAIELLRAMPREDGNGHVFIGRAPGSKISHMTVSRALGALRPGVTTHGFRSAFSDWAHEQTAHANHTIETSLAHAVGNEVERAYRRGDQFDKRRKLMNDWAAFVGTPATGKRAGNVVSLRGA